MSEPEDNTPEEEIDDYNSGPYCRHWNSPSYCDDLCMCGHYCSNHAWDNGCARDNCTCVGFVDVE